MRIALLAGLLLAAVACSGRGGDGGEPQRELADLGPARTAVPGILGRRCYFLSDLEELPRFAALARPGTRGTLALLGRQLTAADTVELSVYYDDEGRLTWVRAIRSTAPQPDALALEQVLLDALEEDGPPDWGVRVVVVAGDIAGVEPSVTCPAGPRDAKPRMVAGPRTASALAAFDQVRGRRFPVHILLDERGRILDVRLPQSSGHTVVDQFLIDWVRATDFDPKLHDGIPVPTVLEETLRIPYRW